MSSRQYISLLVVVLLGLGLLAPAGAMAQTGGAEPPPPGATPPAEPVLPPPSRRQPIPRNAHLLATELATATTQLHTAIDGWLTLGDPGVGGPPPEVAGWALYQQRIYALLVWNRRLAVRTIRRLPPERRGGARDTVGARRSLGRIAGASARWRIGKPRPAAELLGYYREAEARFRVPWRVLAAINFVETGFGRLKNRSIAGARGPMQFMPATWRAYGLGGNVRRPRDAILGAANYLRASGARRNMRRALFAYNRSRHYVTAVLRYARRMKRDSRAFYAYYSWEPFVRVGPPPR